MNNLKSIKNYILKRIKSDLRIEKDENYDKILDEIFDFKKIEIDVRNPKDLSRELLLLKIQSLILDEKDSSPELLSFKKMILKNKSPQIILIQHQDYSESKNPFFIMDGVTQNNPQIKEFIDLYSELYQIKKPQLQEDVEKHKEYFNHFLYLTKVDDNLLAKATSQYVDLNGLKKMYQQDGKHILSANELLKVITYDNYEQYIDDLLDKNEKDIIKLIEMKPYLLSIEKLVPILKNHFEKSIDSFFIETKKNIHVYNDYFSLYHYNLNISHLVNKSFDEQYKWKKTLKKDDFDIYVDYIQKKLKIPRIDIEDRNVSHEKKIKLLLSIEKNTQKITSYLEQPFTEINHLKATFCIYDHLNDFLFKEKDVYKNKDILLLLELLNRKAEKQYLGKKHQIKNHAKIECFFQINEENEKKSIEYLNLFYSNSFYSLTNQLKNYSKKQVLTNNELNHHLLQLSDEAIYNIASTYSKKDLSQFLENIMIDGNHLKINKILNNSSIFELIFPQDNLKDSKYLNLYYKNLIEKIEHKIINTNEIKNLSQIFINTKLLPKEENLQDDIFNTMQGNFQFHITEHHEKYLKKPQYIDIMKNEVGCLNKIASSWHNNNKNKIDKILMYVHQGDNEKRFIELLKSLKDSHYQIPKIFTGYLWQSYSDQELIEKIQNNPTESFKYIKREKYMDKNFLEKMVQLIEKNKLKTDFFPEDLKNILAILPQENMHQSFQRFMELSDIIHILGIDESKEIPKKIKKV